MLYCYWLWRSSGLVMIAFNLANYICLVALSKLFAFLLGVVIFVFFLYFLSFWAGSRDVLGPIFAALTNLPRLLWVRTRRAHEIHVAFTTSMGLWSAWGWSWSLLELLTWALSGIGAGADISVNVIRALFRYFLKHPQTLYKLRDEIDSASKESWPSWKTIRSLPYFEACVKGAARIHPSIGLPLERVVRPGGSEICGRFILGAQLLASTREW